METERPLTTAELREFLVYVQAIEAVEDGEPLVVPQDPDKVELPN